jgi:hypothetical protein
MKIVKSRSEFVSSLYRKIPAKCVGAEIGVLYGQFSAQLLNVLDPKLLILIDPFETGGSQYGIELNNQHTAYSDENDYVNLLDKFKKEISSGQVIVKRQFSYDAVDYFSDNSLDFIYLDGSHLYEDVKRDLNDWLPKLKNDGLMCGHDYIKFSSFGVIQAVDEFIKEKGFEMILFNEDGGDWALKRKQ